MLTPTSSEVCCLSSSSTGHFVAIGCHDGAVGMMLPLPNRREAEARSAAAHMAAAKEDDARVRSLLDEAQTSLEPLMREQGMEWESTAEALRLTCGPTAFEVEQGLSPPNARSDDLAVLLDAAYTDNSALLSRIKKELALGKQSSGKGRAARLLTKARMASLTAAAEKEAAARHEERESRKALERVRMRIWQRFAEGAGRVDEEQAAFDDTMSSSDIVRSAAMPVTVRPDELETVEHESGGASMHCPAVGLAGSIEGPDARRVDPVNPDEARLPLSGDAYRSLLADGGNLARAQQLDPRRERTPAGAPCRHIGVEAGSNPSLSATRNTAIWPESMRSEANVLEANRRVSQLTTQTGRGPLASGKRRRGGVATPTAMRGALLKQASLVGYFHRSRLQTSLTDVGFEEKR